MAKQNRTGPPTKYTEELLEAARDYVDNYESHDHAFPSDIGLASVVGIGTSTLYRWAEDDDKAEFHEILDKINTQQQLVAWNKGLKGEYNAALVKLLLGKHGYHEKQDNTLSGPNGGPVETFQTIELIPGEFESSGEDTAETDSGIY